VNSSAPRRNGTSPSLAFGAGLLVLGTLAGMIFGVLDQNGRRAETPVATQVAASVPAAADAVPAEEEAPAAAPVATPVASPAPRVASKPAPKAAPVVAATPAPAAPRTTAPAAHQALTSTVAQPARPSVAAEKLPLPNHRPGRVELGAVQAAGRELLVPVRGARALEKMFVLKMPDRVVVDLAANGFDGQKEMSGRGAIRKLRMGSRQGGVRLVLDVKDERTAKAAKVTRRNGVLTVVVPAQ
jgi:hypothetical protein